MSSLDALAHRVSRAIHRLDPSFPVMTEWPSVGSVWRRGRARWLQPIYERAYLWRAIQRRGRLHGVTFIGVTGSSAKTTTKELIAAVLSTRLKGQRTGGTLNTTHVVARTVRRVAPGTEFCVVEVGMGLTGPGTLDATLAVLQPRIGLVTNIGTDHASAFTSIEALAAEKAKMIACLPPDGIAVLNADDPRVLAMRSRFGGRVITYGRGTDAEVRAEDVSGDWPDRLAFTLVHGGQSFRVGTLFAGRHWVYSALAAAAVGVAMGIPLEVAARALGQVAPARGRMSVERHPDGVDFVRDDWKASATTMAVPLEFMKHARATRKVIVLGSISDLPGNDRHYVAAVRQAAEVADIVCCVGPTAFKALRAKAGPDDERIRAFSSSKAVSDHLRLILRPGDLVLLKGSNSVDHLARIALARVGTVACWQEGCRKLTQCDACELLQVPSSPQQVAAGPQTPSDETESVPSGESRGEPAGQILVGLGNPAARYRHTPHNVGHAVVEHLAESLGAEWTREAEAEVARAEWKGEPICLVKPAAWMNETGPALSALARRLGVGPEQCILVYDDLDLPLGSVRMRMRGSDGGHRGVRSVLETFQTDQFRRVKVGVKRAGPPLSGMSEVLTPFTGDEAAAMARVYPEAVAKLAELLRTASPASRVASQ